METIYAAALSPWGRVLLLSLIIGLATQGIKATTPMNTLLRAILPTIPIIIGAICGMVPGVLIGEAKVLLGAGAGALSSSVVEIFNRYKDHVETQALKKIGIEPPTTPK